MPKKDLEGEPFDPEQESHFYATMVRYFPELDWWSRWNDRDGPAEPVEGPLPRSGPLSGGAIVASQRSREFGPS